MYKDREILSNIFNLYAMYKKGLLGGEILPEDSNPDLEKGSAANYHYFTLPMALNYQRNSYTLWVSAKDTFLDTNTSSVFNPQSVLSMDEDTLKEKLLSHKLAVQPIKHVQIWKALSKTMVNSFDGDIRNLFIENNWHIPYILDYIQIRNKKLFPFLSGQKLCSYWLHTMERYTDAKFTGREFLSIAPDTHIIKATIKLGLIEADTLNSSSLQNKVNSIWQEILQGTELIPIDMHTPLWFWSRSGFKAIIS